MGTTVEHLYNMSPTWLQNALVSTYGYRLYHKRYKGNFEKILDLVRESRQWSREQIESYQSEQLFRMVRHCRQSVPYYQKKFAELALHENHVTSTSDIHRLPILTKQELRENMEDFKAHGNPAYITQHTSGSTGTPLALEVNEFTYKLAMALLVDHEEHHGIPFGSKRATFAGRMIQPSTLMKPPFARMNLAENQKLFSSYHLNEETFPWYHEELGRFQPLELVGYPSSISDLAGYYQKSGILPKFKPNAIITNSETLLEWQRETIEHVFKCPVWDYYGTAEYVIFAGQEQYGYRISPIIGIAELAPTMGLKDSGQLIATTLTNFVMPLLRYEIGDRAELGEENIQRISGPLYSLARIEGRTDDYIELPDGRKIGRIDHIFKGLEGIMRAQVIQKSKHECSILIQKNKETTIIDEKKLIENFRNRTGHEITVNVRYMDEIPKAPNGKFKSVLRN